jgi:hypothetical protein
LELVFFGTTSDKELQFIDGCYEGDVPIYNGNDYLVESDGWCSAYINQKVCCVEDKLKKVYKMLKKGGKRSSKYSRGY